MIPNKYNYLCFFMFLFSSCLLGLSENSERDLPIFSLNPNREPDLATLEYIENISGGTGGVHLFKDANNKKWVLKAWENYNHGVNELLARVLIEDLQAGDEKELFIYNRIPSSLHKGIIQKLNERQLFSLSSYVESKENISSKQVAIELSKYFVMCSLLSYWDIKLDNLIYNDQGLHFIDMGGSLLYRSLGARKTDKDNFSPYLVSELKTLRQPKISSQLAYEAFAKLSEDDIKNQLEPIIKKASLILSQTDVFCRKMRSNERVKIVSMLSHRLRHLTNLYHYLNNQYDSQSEKLIKANLNDASGTLLWTKIDDKGHLLLGKRVGHEWYGNLGGHANPGEYLHQTAIRETWEESGKLIKLKEQDLVNQASHRLLRYCPEEKRFISYVTYLQEVNYLDPKLIKDSEYTEYTWLPAEDLLGALERTDSFIEEEGQKTIKVNNIVLHPPFYTSLKQAPILNWLKHLIANQPIATIHTQSVDKDNFKALTSAHSYLMCPEDEALDLCYGFMKSPAVAKATTSQRIALDKGASHHMLDYLAKSKNIQNLSTIEQLKKLYPDSLQTDEQAKYILTIIDEEKLHPDHYVVYHGLRPDIWFAYRVLSHLRHIFDGSPVQTDVLRSVESYFDELSDANSLFNFIKNGHENDNYSPGFTRAGVSCNITLFGNHEDSSSSTIHYFMSGINLRPVNFETIIEETLNNFNLRERHKLINDLISVKNKIFNGDNSGVLLQIFIPKENINASNYICGSGGLLVKNKLSNNYAEDTEEIFNKISQGERVSNLNYKHNDIQTRLHANLTKFSNVIVKDYFSNEILSTDELDKQISDILYGNISEFIMPLLRDKNVYKQTPPLFSQIAKDLLSWEKWDMDQTSSLSKAYLNGDLLILKESLNNPELKLEYYDSDTLEKINISDSPLIKFVKKYDKEILSSFQTNLADMTLKQKIDIADAINLSRVGIKKELFEIFLPYQNNENKVKIIKRLLKLDNNKFEKLVKLFNALHDELSSSNFRDSSFELIMDHLSSYNDDVFVLANAVKTLLKHAGKEVDVVDLVGLLKETKFLKYLIDDFKKILSNKIYNLSKLQLSNFIRATYDYVGSIDEFIDIIGILNITNIDDITDLLNMKNFFTDDIVNKLQTMKNISNDELLNLPLLLSEEVPELWSKIKYRFFGVSIVNEDNIQEIINDPLLWKLVDRNNPHDIMEFFAKVKNKHGIHKLVSLVGNILWLREKNHLLIENTSDIINYGTLFLDSEKEEFIARAVEISSHIECSSFLSRSNLAQIVSLLTKIKDLDIFINEFSWLIRKAKDFYQIELILENSNLLLKYKNLLKVVTNIDDIYLILKYVHNIQTCEFPQSFIGKISHEFKSVNISQSIGEIRYINFTEESLIAAEKFMPSTASVAQWKKASTALAHIKEPGRLINLIKLLLDRIDDFSSKCELIINFKYIKSDDNIGELVKLFIRGLDDNQSVENMLSIVGKSVYCDHISKYLSYASQIQLGSKIDFYELLKLIMSTDAESLENCIPILSKIKNIKALQSIINISELHASILTELKPMLDKVNYLEKKDVRELVRLIEEIDDDTKEEEYRKELEIFCERCAHHSN